MNSSSIVAAARTSRHLKAELCRGNMAILDQKLELLSNLDDVFDEASNYAFTSTCPIVGASIGQHFRHSLDHIELPAMALINDHQLQDFHYDKRNRGGSSERSMKESRERIQGLLDIFSNEKKKCIIPCDSREDSDHGTEFSKDDDANDALVQVHFMLSGDGHEFGLKSFLTREMQFAMHHAIHHLAMVKIISENHLGLNPDMIPSDFGKAPSTLHFEEEE